MKISTLKDAVEFGAHLIEWGVEVVRAAKDGDLKRVDELLPEEMQLTIARRRAEAKAREKFGA